MESMESTPRTPPVDEDLVRALQHVDGPWWLVREAVSSTRMDHDDREGTHLIEGPVRVDEDSPTAP